MRNLLCITAIFLLISITFCTSQTIRRSGAGEFIQTRPAKVLILDFYNASGDENLDILGAQIANKLQGDLSFNFAVYDTGYVRSYITRNGYSSEDLFNPNIAKQIGDDIGVDYVIRGTYSSYEDDIQVIIRFTPINPDLPTYQYDYVLGKSSALIELDTISEEIKTDTKEEIPPIEENTKESMELAAEASVSNPVKVEEIVETYVRGDDIPVGTPHEIEPDMIDFEEPSPRPQWVSQIPTNPNKVFFVGQSFDQPSYYNSLELAMQDAYLQMSMAIGTKVESSLSIRNSSAGGSTNSEMTQDLLITTLSNVRNVQREQTYYTIKSVTNTYTVSVLYSMERQVLENLIAESIEIEHNKRQEELARLQQEMEFANNEADLRRMRREMAELQFQMESYQGLLQDQHLLTANLQQEQVRHQYEQSNEIRSSGEVSTGEEIVLESGTSYPYSTPGWITLGCGLAVATGGGVLLGIASAFDEDKEVSDYLNNPTLSSYNDALDNRESAAHMEIAGWTLLGTGSAALVTSIILLTITEDSSMNTSATIIPTHEGVTVQMSQRF